MVAFFERSFLEAALRLNVSPRVLKTSAWLKDTSLFVEAWGRVCCAFIVAWYISGWRLTSRSAYSDGEAMVVERAALRVDGRAFHHLS